MLTVLLLGKFYREINYIFQILHSGYQVGVYVPCKNGNAQMPCEVSIA